MIPLATADKLAAKIVAGLEPLCLKIEVAGSIRRRRATVNDVDIVCIPKADPGSIIAPVARSTATWRRSGSRM